MTTYAMPSTFREVWNGLAKEIFATSLKNGFHGNATVDNVPTKLMLVVSELVEAMEAHRNNNAMSDKLEGGYTGLEEELADAVIRIMDLGQLLDLDIADAVVAKMQYNSRRAYLHGGKLY